MAINNIAIAQAYYTAIGEKNIENAEKYLHPHVQFISPFATITGKEGVLKAVRGFTTIFKSLTIRAKFGSDDQAMLVYDIDCPTINGTFSGASLMTFQDDLIAKVELFYDPRPFEQKKDVIFKYSPSQS